MRPIVFFCVTLLAAAGCSRGHYRRSADAETYPILGSRTANPAAALGNVNLSPPPESRLHDPFDPDRPPRPPDDPDAAPFMARPNGLTGSSHWDRDGRRDAIEYEGWETCLPRPAAGGPVKLDPILALDLALLHSREYRTATEDVYISALGLTLNRFEFAVRWFATNNTGFATVPGTSDILTSTSDVGFSKAFAAGGQLLVDFANSVVVEYAGTGRTRVNSNLIVNLSQPLLRGGGRAVRLESLTQAERNVLYAVRDFSRFRKQFWASVTTQNGGHLSLLLTLQGLRNQQANLRSREQFYKLYQELIKGGKVSPVELDQVYQSFVGARVAVAQSETVLQNSLDSYKLTLGLPIRLPVELDDTLLDPFVLTDPAPEAVRVDVDAFQKARNAVLDVKPPAEELAAFQKQLLGFTARLKTAADAVGGEIKSWPAAEKNDEGEDADSRTRAAAARADLTAALPKTLVELAKLEAELRTPPHPKTGRDDVLRYTRDLLTLADQVLTIQTQLRVYRITLPPLDWDKPRALAFARENRLDLMSSRARVTDTWRRVTVAANALRGGLTVTAGANIGTDPDNDRPFNLAAEASRYTVGVQIDGPLNRLAERNAYRLSLIQYQRSRRDYLALSDRIDQAIRADLRGLKLQRLSFAAARQTLLSAARQLEGAKIRVLSRDRAADSTSTLNILNAQDNLLQARNALAGTFVSYEQQRVQLLLDLEALQLDDRGRPANDTRPPAPVPATPPVDR